MNAAKKEEQIKLAEISHLLFGETAIIPKSKRKKMFPAREFKMSPVSNMCADHEIGLEWAGGLGVKNREMSCENK